MFLAINHEVKRLTRVKFGNITIDDLSEGEVRILTPNEVKTLYELSKKSRVIKKGE